MSFWSEGEFSKAIIKLSKIKNLLQSTGTTFYRSISYLHDTFKSSINIDANYTWVSWKMSPLSAVCILSLGIPKGTFLCILSLSLFLWVKACHCICQLISQKVKILTLRIGFCQDRGSWNTNIKTVHCYYRCLNLKSQLSECSSQEQPTGGTWIIISRCFLLKLPWRDSVFSPGISHQIPSQFTQISVSSQLAKGSF